MFCWSPWEACPFLNSEGGVDGVGDGVEVGGRDWKERRERNCSQDGKEINLKEEKVNLFNHLTYVLGTKLSSSYLLAHLSSVSKHFTDLYELFILIVWIYFDYYCLQVYLFISSDYCISQGPCRQKDEITYLLLWGNLTERNDHKSVDLGGFSFLLWIDLWSGTRGFRIFVYHTDTLHL